MDIGHRAADDEVTRCWQAYLRRFALEHTFRLWKQTLGWTAPKIRSPQAADRWTWLVTADRMQLHRNTVKYRIARSLEVRGRGLGDDRLDVELALEVVRLLGDVVLR